MARLLELTLQTRFAGQIFLNRFNYVWDEVSPSPDNLAQKLIDATGVNTYAGGEYEGNTLIWAIKAMLHQLCTFEIMTARDVDNVFDIAEFLFPTGDAGQGSNIGDAAPPFVALGFRTSKTRGDIKRGAKRFSGLGENVFGTSGTISSAYLSLGNQVAVELSRILPDGGTGQFKPAVVHKKKVEVLNDDGGPTGRFKYVYWGDDDLNVQNSMFPVVFDLVTSIRSQTSRQFGRGR